VPVVEPVAIVKQVAKEEPVLRASDSQAELKEH